MEGKVTLYGSETCNWCTRTRAFLKEHKVKFNDVDVGRNEKKAMEMIKKSGQQGIPVIEIGKEIVIGFNEEKLKKALKIK
ncbi:MAG: glutaredoxin family protein [Nanoarchaeota archaeon]|nr:glutaredoxin family protein [Nanoarchaeota archaeon]